MRRITIAILALLLAAPLHADTITPVGKGVKFICQTSAPAPINSYREWVRCADGHYIDTGVDNTDRDVTFGISSTGVTPGSYTNANITVGADGRLSSAANGLAGGGGGYTTIQQNGTPQTQRGALNFTPRFSCVDNGGSTRTDCDFATSGVSAANYGDATHVPQITFDAYGRATSASNIAISTLPNQSGNSGKFLQTDGAIASWQAVTTGVTSAAMTVPSIMSVSGSPITSTGTFAVSLANESTNAVFAGPSSGGATTPTFRALTSADLSSAVLRIRRIIAQPADTTDFFVSLGTTLSNDSYAVSCTQSSLGSVFVLLAAPDVAGSDRNTTQFRLQTSDILPTGETIDCIVSQF